jgi:cation diffusion facilitator family transporter
MTLQQRKERVALLSVISNAFLVIFKLIVGVLIASVAIMSEAIHSGMDLLASFFAMFSVKTSYVPADDSHPFGHGKVESISGLIEALLIFVAAFWIILEAIRKLGTQQTMEFAGWGVGVMLLSAVLNLIVSQLLFRVGKEADSIALQADAWHLRTDVYTSAGVMVSLAVIWISHKFFPNPNIHWLDPLAGLFVAIFILRAAYNLTVQSIRDLMDAQLPPEEADWIRSMIISRQEAIHGFHQLRTRKAGNFRFIEFHIKVDPQMSVADSHRITEELSRIIENRLPHSSVTIHIEPCDGRCEAKCIAGCLLPAEKRPGPKHGFC